MCANCLLQSSSAPAIDHMCVLANHLSPLTDSSRRVSMFFPPSYASLRSFPTLPLTPASTLLCCPSTSTISQPGLTCTVAHSHMFAAHPVPCVLVHRQIATLNPRHSRVHSHSPSTTWFHATTAPFPTHPLSYFRTPSPHPQVLLELSKLVVLVELRKRKFIIQR